MLTEAELIKGCKKFDGTSQKALYCKFASKMKGVCIRYSSSREEAEDILQEGFIKVFSNIDSFSGSGSLEGWIRRIMVNTALSFYKKNKKYQHENLDSYLREYNDDENGSIKNASFIESEDESEFYINEDFTQEQLLTALANLPESFKIVFNLFYLEDQPHKEIALLLGIDEKTSRTRLFRAKKMLQKELTELSLKKARKIFS